uniref:Transcription factor 25 n=1 Tax=Syphacia muris TaxID=451379 RepID=A0A0N5ARI9_9BILA
MSTKNLKRYLEQRDARLKTESVEESSESCSDDDELKLQNKFLFLDIEEENGESFVGDKDNEKIVHDEQSKTFGSERKSKCKSKNRKNKKKAKKVPAEADDEMLSSSEKPLNAAGSSSKELLFEKDIFKVDMKMLSGEIEFLKILGQRTSGNQSHRRRKLCGRIVREKNTWPPLNNFGFSMEKASEQGNIWWFKFEHHSTYKVMQELFWSYASSEDHEAIHEILLEQPYHLDSLLVMAEVMRQQEDYQVSRDLIERGIFYCESNFCSHFELNNFNHRLSYDHFENRAFYLLLHQHMQNMLGRSCFETALNLAKLIYRLDSEDDPLGILLTIDVLALRAGKYEYFFQLYNTLKEPKSLDRLPNFVYSFALAHFLTYLKTNDAEELKEANDSLATAIYHFPTVIVQLLNKLNIQPNEDIEKNVYMNVLAHERESEGSKHLTKVYLSLSESLWKESETLLWLEKATLEAVSHFSEHLEELEEWKKIRKLYVGLPRNVERHGFLWNVIRNAEWTVFDPAPPLQSTSRYLSVESPRTRETHSALLRLFTSLVVNERQHIKGNEY